MSELVRGTAGGGDAWPPSRRGRGRRRAASARRPRRACRRAPSAATRSPVRACRCGSPTSCSWNTARARSWRCRRTTSATSSSRARTTCRCGWWSSRRASRLDPRRWRRRGRGRAGSSSRGTSTASTNEEAKERITAALAERGLGEARVTYRLRDWGVSRQRAWGTPIPVVYCDRDGTVPVPESELPVRLPDDLVFTGRGGSPLAAHAAFVHTTLPALRWPGTARDRHHGHVRPVVVVLRALLLAALGRHAVRSRGGRLLARPAWRGPVHRRHRARRAPPAVRAVLHQGAARSRLPPPRRAVPPPADPGHGHQGRRQDEQVEGQRRRSRSPDRALRSGHGASLLSLRLAAGARSRLERSGRRGDEPLPRPTLAPRARRRASPRPTGLAGVDRGPRRMPTCTGRRTTRSSG